MNASKIFFRRFFNFSLVFTIALISISAVNAQSNSVDLSFNAVPSKEVLGTGRFLIQPDGKILVFGGTFIVNGTVVNRIARLNPDGSLDNSFNCQCANGGSAVVQPDGKIIIAGSSSSNLTTAVAASIQRLNSDGSVDNSFVSPFDAPVPQQNKSATVWAVQPDGKVLVGITLSNVGFIQNSLIRLNANGTLDNTFTAITLQGGSGSFQYITKVALTAGGKILVNIRVSGFTSGSVLRRYNSDGSIDTTFETVILGYIGFSNYVNDFDLQSDGKILIVGVFNSINGIARSNIARLQPAGNVDLSFVAANTTPAIQAANRVKILSNGQILVDAGNRLIRFNTDGSVDDTFNTPTNTVQIGYWEIDSAGRVFISAGFLENGAIVYRIVRLTADGGVDNSFNVNIELPASIFSLAVQTDNKVIVGDGHFTRINGVPRNKFARLNADGTTDTTFNPGSGFDADVDKIIVQPDGKILVGGAFTKYDGTTRFAIVRLNSDGSLDAAFNPGLTVSSSVFTIALQADGKVLVGGIFSSAGGQARTSIARLNADGSLDAGFNPVFSNPVIRSIVVQADGKIMVGGSFVGVNGFNRSGVARLNADGSLDAAFNAGSVFSVRQVELQPDGKYLVLSNGIVRFNNNGTPDTTFQVESFDDTINQIFAQPDGSIIVVGRFTTVGGVPRLKLARLKPNGKLDVSFFPDGADNEILAVIRQADGKILIGGYFTSVANVTRIGVARLLVAPFRNVTPFDFDGDGRADISVFRPSNGVWYLQQSQAGFSGLAFGASGDLITPADYDGDGKTDIAVYRGGIWYLQRSSAGFTGVAFGEPSDVPVPADYDGDGRADVAVYRPSNGVWYLLRSNLGYTYVQFGIAEDKPTPGDFDGDGKNDIAVYRPSNGGWYRVNSSTGQWNSMPFGASGDVIVPADYDGDGKTDLAVYRPANGTWYLQRSTLGFTGLAFGVSEDKPIPADYDGDGRADIAVFRPSNGVWYLNRSTHGFTGVLFGVSEDKPIPNAYVR